MRTRPEFRSASLLSFVLPALLTGTVAWAASPAELQEEYGRQARAGNPSFSGFSASRGKSIYLARQKNSKGETLSCATCHTEDPRAAGMTRARKEIRPLAPSADARRFTDPAKVEKWFRRNCNDVLSRPCTAQEKGDVIAYLLSLQ